jgi:hypothetical protein
MTSRPLIDLTGFRFGKLTVIRRAPDGPRHETRWLCQCDCGKTSTPRSKKLRAGTAQSCGCDRGRRGHLDAPPREKFHVRVRLPQLAQIKAWIKQQPEAMTVPEALRRLADKAMTCAEKADA